MRGQKKCSEEGNQMESFKISLAPLDILLSMYSICYKEGRGMLYSYSTIAFPIKRTNTSYTALEQCCISLVKIV